MNEKKSSVEIFLVDGEVISFNSPDDSKDLIEMLTQRYRDCTFVEFDSGSVHWIVPIDRISRVRVVSLVPEVV